LKEQEDQVRMWIEGSSQKPGSSSSPIEQTALSLDGRVACLVENTGRLVCCEVDEPQHTQVFCSQPLKHVWVDECGDLIFVQDDKNSFYAFEWIGGKVK
jgi:hypothetical protein